MRLGMNMRRFYLTVLFAGSVLLILAYTAFWFLAAAEVRESAARWAEEHRAEGLEVAYRDIAVDGFPMYLHVVVDDLSFATGENGWAWRGSEAVFDLRPWDMSKIVFDLPGTYQVSFPARSPGPSGEGRRSVFAVAGYAGGSIHLDDAGNIWAGFIDIGDLEIVPEGRGVPLVVPARVSRVRISTRIHPPGEPAHRFSTLDIAFKLEGINLPGAKDLPLGPDFALIQGEASLMGSLPGGPLKKSIAAWRDSGGTVEVRIAAVHWGELEIEGEGTFALDAELQPVGALSTSIRGFEQVIDSLVKHGILKPAEAATASVVLGLMAKRPKDGGPPRLNIPLSVQDRRLYVGPVKLLELAPLEWE